MTNELFPISSSPLLALLHRAGAEGAAWGWGLQQGHSTLGENS